MWRFLPPSKHLRLVPTTPQLIHRSLSRLDLVLSLATLACTAEVPQKYTVHQAIASPDFLYATDQLIQVLIVGSNRQFA